MKKFRLILTLSVLFLLLTVTEKTIYNLSEKDNVIINHAVTVHNFHDDLVLYKESVEEVLVEEPIKELVEQEITTVYSLKELSADDISVYTDLSVMNTISTDDMDMLISYWTEYTKDSILLGQGQAFIEASAESGLDPVYLLAHAGLESGWGSSQYAKERYNFFGIGAFDSNPDSAYSMADNVSEGIINGAEWIARNYYNEGQTSLYTMRYNNGTHEYCTSETWMYNIHDIIVTSYNLLDDYH